MVTTNITSATVPFTTPEVVPTVRAALRDLPGVQILVCDTEGTAAAAVACEQKAVQEHVAAVLDAASGVSQNQAILTRAGIPVVGTSDATKPNSFVLSSGTAEYAGIGIGLANAGCRKLGTIYIDGTEPLTDAIKQGMVSKGGQEVARAAVAANAADLSPAVAKITGAGAQCIAISVAPTAAVQVLTALKQSGKKLIAGGTSGVFPDAVITSLGPLADGLLVIDQTLAPQSNDPGIDEIKAGLRAAKSKDPITQVGIISWVAAKFIAAALPKVSGDVSAASLTTALNGLREVNVNGLVPPLSAVELKSPAYTRLFNPYALVYKVDGGTFQKQGDFFDLTPVLQAG